ncbi:hypothetical protein [Micromonospora sp. MW-13]|uniref:hypothetical protein n=1 Tax=Micromonospora sp. MW-13 TaxID=2094022 RepID=UPI001404F321|nr:hypothetical protein [Micromonospora sp. MW-13]
MRAVMPVGFPIDDPKDVDRVGSSRLTLPYLLGLAALAGLVGRFVDGCGPVRV